MAEVGRGMWRALETAGYVANSTDFFAYFLDFLPEIVFRFCPRDGTLLANKQRKMSGKAFGPTKPTIQHKH
jgi:hypothetical protein